MDDITSLTKEEENKRQQIAKEKIPQKRKRQAGSESNTEVAKYVEHLQRQFKRRTFWMQVYIK